MNLTRSSVKLFVANIATAGLQFLGITFFARELGASQLGIFFLFQALLGMLAIPADFGLRGAVEKRISEGESPGSFLSSAIAVKLIPITAIILGILLFRPWINRYLGADLSVYLALAIVLQEASQLAVSVLKGELRVGETAVLNIARQVTWVGGGVLLVGYGLQAEAMVYSLLAGLSILLIWGWYRSSVPLGKPSITHARSLFNYSKYSVISSIGGYFYSWMDIAIIGLFLTQAHVGVYETAWRVTVITLLFSQSIASTIFPQISQWDAEGSITQIESLIHRAITPSLLLVVPAFFGTLILSNEILVLIFGPEFALATTVLIILAAEKILQSVHLIFGRALQGINRPDLAALATVVSVIVNLVLNITLILSFGLVGAAIATALSFSVNTVLHAYYLSQRVRIEFPYVEVGWCTVSAAGMSGALMGLKIMIQIDSILRLFGAIGLGVVVYGVLILLFRPIRLMVFQNTKSLLAS